MADDTKKPWSPPPVASTQQQEGGARLILISLGMALLAVIIANVFIQQAKQQSESETFPVYVLRRNVKPGEKFVADMLEKPRAFPLSLRDNFTRTLNPIGESRKLSRLADASPFYRAASAGQIVTEDLFEAPLGAADPSKIAPGKVLMSLPINSQIQPGNLRPGDYVAIQAPFNAGGAVPEVMVVIEKVLVNAVGAYTSNEDAAGRPTRIGNYKSITIEVTPTEALRMSMIHKMAAGPFELLLVSPAAQAPSGINPKVVELLNDLLRSQGPRGTGRPASPTIPE